MLLVHFMENALWDIFLLVYLYVYDIFQVKQIENGIVSDELTEELDNEINRIRNDKNWWEAYMKTVVHDMDVRFEGIEIGRKEGILQNLISLVQDDILTVSEAARRAGMSEEEFETKKSAIK